MGVPALMEALPHGSARGSRQNHPYPSLSLKGIYLQNLKAAARGPVF